MKAWHLLVLAMVFLPFIYGITGGFHRSDAWMYTSIAATAVVAAIPAFLLTRLALHRGPDAAMLRRAGFFSALMLFGLIFVIVALYAFFIVAYALPDLYTRAAGTPFEVHDVAYTKYRSGGIRECRYQLRGPHFAQGTARKGHFCVGERAFESLPDKGRVSVGGIETWFGRRLDYVVLEPENPAR